MKITLKRLALSNFKGVKDLSILFSSLTSIYGENAAGKTTVMDAFLWLLFGKDSSDRKDFEVKPLDAANKPMEKVEVEVTAEIDVDGQEHVIKRVLREKWVKERGAPIPEFKGNETLYFWNEVPMKAGEYQAKINSIVDESIFKLITNTLYFNQLKWQDRRKVLIDIAGSISDAEIAAGNEDYKKLVSLLSNKSLDEYKREVAGKKKKLKDELALIPSRINEATIGKPEVLDWKDIKQQINIHEQAIAGIDATIEDAAKALQAQHQALQVKQGEVHAFKMRKNAIEFEVRNTVRGKLSGLLQEIADVERSIRNNQNESAQNTSQFISNERRIANLNTQRETLRGQWTAENNKQLTFDENNFNCPACKRPLDETDIERQKEELTKNFNTAKQTKLNDIQTRGGALKTECEELAKQNTEITAANNALKLDLVPLQAKLAELNEQKQRIASNEEDEVKDALNIHAEYATVTTMIAELETEISKPTDASAVDNTELKNQKATIQQEINSLRLALGTRDQIEKADKRILELTDQENNYSQQIADLESMEFTIEQFTKAKIDALESRINGRFSFVKFKLFEQQINGGEVETCQTLINGVPFSDANNAAKINAGLDIINTLCQHHNVYAPIFIDNRESVNNLIPSPSQIVNLIVSTDKKLRVA